MRVESGTNGESRPLLLLIGSNSVSNTDKSAREVSDDNGKHETQNYSGWLFHDFLSPDRLESKLIRSAFQSTLARCQLMMDRY